MHIWFYEKNTLTKADYHSLIPATLKGCGSGMTEYITNEYLSACVKLVLETQRTESANELLLEMFMSLYACVCVCGLISVCACACPSCGRRGRSSA